MLPASATAVLYAVVVGSNVPTGPGVAPLRYADDDAIAYAELLREAGADVTLLTAVDDDTQPLARDVAVDGPPTRRALDAAVERLGQRLDADRRAGRASEAFLVFTGHGDVDHGEGYVQLDGARLRRGDLYDAILPRVSADRVHLVVDTCKSYFFAFERGAARRPHEGHFVAVADAERFANVGFILSTSSGGDSHEWEQYRGGVFSHELRSALRGAADVDGDGTVSYAEVGAFVRRANAAIDNSRFRPEFTVVAPRGSVAGAGTRVLGWSAPGAPPPPASSAVRRLTVDGAPGHFFVEDAAGRRLLDAHPARPGLVVHLPARPLFVHLVDDDAEYAIDAAGDVRLSSLDRHPSRWARRGALVESFALLFREPLDASDVVEFARRPSPLPVDPPDTSASDPARGVAWASGAVAVAAALVGGGARLGAFGTAQSASGRSQADIAAANARIGVLDGVAVTAWAVAGVSAAAAVVAALLPRLAHRR